MVGRKQEQETINRLVHSKKSEFLAIYGRRRVGKTFLVTSYFKDTFSFKHTGLSPYDTTVRISLTDQLQAFYYSLLRYGLAEDKPSPKSWLEAFYLLEQLLESQPKRGGKKIVFLDELPWMDTPRSKFLSAFESFYNGWASGRGDILLIVCGSSSSWILKNLINNRGGLYNRITCQIKLIPFTLRECEAYFQSNQLLLNRYDITRAYMALGGIPYYLSYFEPGLSVEQNIDKLFFSETAPLRNELQRLFQSLFAHSENYVRLIEFLAKRNEGFSRDEIVDGLEITSGGGLSDMLGKLEESDFIERYKPVQLEGDEEDHYRIKDCFCLFFLRFVHKRKINDYHYWENVLSSRQISTWVGLAFEQVCRNHIDSIKRGLGISGVATRQSSLIIRGDGQRTGTQVDLVLERADRIVNLCEMKFSAAEFMVEKDYDITLRNRIERVRELLKKQQTLFLTLITTYGLKYNSYSGIFQKVLTLDDLF